MRNHLINEKVLIYIPFLLIFIIYLKMFNYQFSLNGGEYEFRFYEVIIFTIIVLIFILLLYFLLSKFI